VTNISLSEQSQCPICGRILRGSNKRNLQRHINLIHLKLKPYNCKYCGRSFGLNAYLKAHVLTHENENAEQFAASSEKFLESAARGAQLYKQEEEEEEDEEEAIAKLEDQ